MFGDEPGTIKTLKPFNLHGQTYWDVTLGFDDGREEEARLGPEGVPNGLKVGDAVTVRRAAMIIIGLEALA
jgi:hypothetical protein